MRHLQHVVTGDASAASVAGVGVARILSELDPNRPNGQIIICKGGSKRSHHEGGHTRVIFIAKIEKLPK